MQQKAICMQVVCVINMHNVHNTPIYNNAQIKTVTLSRQNLCQGQLLGIRASRSCQNSLEDNSKISEHVDNDLDPDAHYMCCN